MSRRTIVDLVLGRVRPMTDEEEAAYAAIDAADDAYERACERFGWPPEGVKVSIGEDGWYSDGKRLDTTPKIIDVEWSEA